MIQLLLQAKVSPFWEKNYALRLEKDPRVTQEKVNEELYR